MSNLYVNILLLLKVLVSFFILYVFIPTRFIKYEQEANTWMDKIIISLVHSNLLIIILVHLLVLFRVYETISLFVSLLIMVILYFQVKSNLSLHKHKTDVKSLTCKVLDWADEQISMLIRIWHKIEHSQGIFLNGIKNFFLYSILNPFDGVIFFGVIAFALYDRFIHAFKYYYYGYFDPYVHLTWVKYLGVNEIYKDGVYPYGYNAIISAINKLFFIDPAIILRFIGPIIGCMMVFTIYYFIKKYAKGYNIISFMAIAAYVTSTELPNNILRQRAALPQEYATVFFLPGIHFLDLFYRTNKKIYLILSAEILALSLLIHLYAAIFIAMGYVILSLIYIKKYFNIKYLKEVFIFMGGASIIGVLPILIGLLSGKKFHALSIEFVEKSASLGAKLNWTVEMFKFYEYNMSLKLILLSALILIAFATISIFIKKDSNNSANIKLFAALSIFSIILYTQFRYPEVGYPSLVDFTRAGIFLAMIGVLLFAFIMYLTTYLPVHKIIKYILQFIIGAVIVVAIFDTEKFKILEGYKAEYDESAYIYYKIKNEFPALNWTLVSPVEQYAYSLSYGWHYNLWEFVKKVVDEPKDKFEFTTDYVFILIEKTPLNSTKQISIEDANKPFPSVSGAYDEYYSNVQKRRIIEAKAYFWLENYMANSGKFTIYFENENLKVYMLKQDGSKPINLVN